MTNRILRVSLRDHALSPAEADVRVAIIPERSDPGTEIRGALLGGLFLGFAEVMSVAYIGSTMRDAVAFGLLFLILLVRPKGLFGTTNERKV